jgi:TP901 family phage tail tape measure protein
MPANSLVFRFIGIDDGAGAQFDRLAGKADLTAASFKKFGLGAVAAFGVVAVASIDMAAKFQASTELIHTQADQTQAQVDDYRKAILSLAGSTATAPEQLSEALFHIASTGVQGAKAIDELRIAAEGAKVGGADLVDVTNALNATIVSGISGTKNYAQAMGELNTIVGTGDMHMEDLANALGTGVLPIIKAFGVTLPQAGAALAVFGDNNIRGAQAATGLRMAVQALAHPVESASSAFAELGLKGDNALNHFAVDLQQGGLQKALTDLHDRLEATGNTGAKTGAILVDAFGKRAGTGIGVLTEEYGRFETKFAEIREAAGTFGPDWTATTKTLSFQFAQLHADIDTVAIRIGDRLVPASLAAIHDTEDLGRAAVTTAAFLDKYKVEVGAVSGLLTAAYLPAIIGGVANTIKYSEILYTVQLRASLTKDALVGLAASFKAMTASEIASASVMTLGLAAVAASGVEAFIQIRDREKEATDQAKQFVAALHINENDQSSIATGMGQVSQYLDVLKRAPSTFGVLNPLIGAFQKQLGSLGSVSARVATNTRLMSDEFGLTTPQVQRLADRLGPNALAGNTADVEQGFQRLIASVANTRDPAKVAAAAFTDMGSAASTATSQINDLSASFDALVGNFVGTQQAELDFKNDLVSLTSALKKSHDSMSLNTAAGRDARGMYLSLISQVESVATAVLKQTGSTDAARKSVAGMVATLKSEVPAGSTVAKKALADLEKFVHGMPSEFTTGGKKAGAGLDDGLIVGIDGSRKEVLAAASTLSSQVISELHRGAGVQSPSVKTAYIGRMLAEGLIQGFKGEGTRLKDLLSQSVQDALDAMQTKVNNALTKQKDALKTAESNLKNELAMRRSDIRGLASTIDQGAGISNIFGTDANGNPTVGNLGQFLGSQVGPLKTFARDLALLHKRGLDNNLLNQIAQLGPQEGIQVAQQILSGQDSIKQLNAAQAEITRYATKGATTVEDSLLKATFLKDRDAVKENSKELRELSRRLDRLLRHAAHEVATHITVEIDKGGALKITRQEAKEIARALHEYGRNVNKNVFTIGPITPGKS